MYDWDENAKDNVEKEKQKTSRSLNVVYLMLCNFLFQYHLGMCSM